MLGISFSSFVEGIWKEKQCLWTTTGLYLNNLNQNSKAEYQRKETKMFVKEKSLTSSANFPALEDPENAYHCPSSNL